MGATTDEQLKAVTAIYEEDRERFPREAMRYLARLERSDWRR